MRTTVYKENKGYVAYMEGKKFSGETKQILFKKIKEAFQSKRCYIRRNELVLS